MNKDYIQLYVNNVIIHLPISEREEVKKELTANIYDMLDDNHSQDNIKAVLESLGSPQALSKHYKSKERYLISPDIYDNYIKTLKIGVPIFALISAFVGFLTAIIEVSFHNVENIETVISKVLTCFFGNLFSSVFYGFALITIVFVIYEQTMKNRKTPKEAFFVENLKEVIDSTKSETIPMIGPVVSIIVTACISIFLILMSIGIIPSLVWIEGEHLRVHSFFSKAFLNHLLVVVPILALGSIILDALKLKYRKWNKVLSYGAIGLSLLFMGLFIFTFLHANMLSPEFISYLETLEHHESSILKGLINGNILSGVGIVMVSIVGMIGVGQSVVRLIKLS